MHWQQINQFHSAANFMFLISKYDIDLIWVGVIYQVADELSRFLRWSDLQWNNSFTRITRARHARRARYINMSQIADIFTWKKIWTELNVEYWTNERIRTELRIDQSIYNKIYAVLEAELSALGGSYEKINNITIKVVLQSDFARITKAFSFVFEEVNSIWLKQCLIHWIQRCNNNRKRRRRSNLKQTMTISDIIDRNVTFRNVSRIFDNIILKYTRFGVERTMRCKPRDLIFSNVVTSNIILNDLRFDLFVKILQKNLAFNVHRKFIFCRFKRARLFECNTVRLWKCALSEMYTLNFTIVIFIIDNVSSDRISIIRLSERELRCWRLNSSKQTIKAQAGRIICTKYNDDFKQWRYCLV